MGVPQEGLNTAVALYAVTDYFCTALTVFSQQAALCITADQLNMIDRKELMKK